MTRPGGVWRNWGRSQKVRPHRIEFPADEGAVRRAVTAASARSLTVKAVGAGHSFSGIAVAAGIMLDLRDLRGLIDVDTDRGRVRLRAGTRLWEIPALLAPYGLAMPNLGDIDRQTVAGAISTGTHGTGLRFGGISTQVVGATLVTADGEVLRVDDESNPELLPAVAVGLGALGILVDVTLQCVPAFVLDATERREPLADVTGSLHDRVGAADHFEFYWFPHTDDAVTKENQRLPQGSPTRPLPPVRRWVDESLLANGVYRATCAVGTVVPATVPPVARVASALMGNRTYADRSHRVFTQSRTVRFREMEYAVALDDLPAAFAAVRDLVTERGWRISFPVEVRVAAADDVWLSTASGRESGYIAVHRYWREDPTEYFEAVGEVMRGFAGRPHWGKEHSLGADELRALYPRFDDFLAVRDRLDPDRLFVNPYLARVLGE
ncbi:FAD-linked oxidoreductase [Microbacterium sp. Gd 4-13]|uniref:D-arabinono-1,4-lactone oxidase n=1 Tax=Microbacterium sp. Gd 4-13 TaxID=2173179 RepID=UPI000D584D7A|nr:D-arabinono-1,4-lactone oxidase [Microbacterium sp. Gd 4-13]PVW06213.1 FAD-linked oxidoreductase [Microbacterium sp. Gd 4-13]